MERGFRVALTPRLYVDGEKCFGPGPERLLEAIDRLGSLKGAAAELDMAYSRAWTLVRSCEKALGFPVLERKAGGRGGGRCSLTDRGRDLLNGYRRMEDELSLHAQTLVKKLLFLEKEEADP